MFQFFFWVFNWIIYISVNIFLKSKQLHFYLLQIKKNIFHIFFIDFFNDCGKKSQKNFESFYFLIFIYRLLRKYKLINLIFFPFNFFSTSFNSIITHYIINYFYNMFLKNFFQFFFKNFYLTCKFKKLTKIPTTTLVYSTIESQFLKKNWKKFFFYLNKFINKKKILKKNNYWRWFFQQKKFNLVHFNENFKLLKTPNKIFIHISSNFSHKHFNKINFSFFRFYYLRKTKIFNKNRYSRHRQIYRTGFYWCLWLSVFLGYSFYFIFYRFTLTIGFLWWFLYFFIILFFWSYFFKFLDIKVFLSEFFILIKWIKLFFFKFFSKKK